MFVTDTGLNPGRYIYFMIWLAFFIGSHLVLRLKPNIALKAMYVWCMGYYFYGWILLPPIPWTLRITYMMLVYWDLFICQSGPRNFQGVSQAHR